MTKIQQRISWRNNKRTRKEMSVPKGMVMHHKDASLRHDDIERYIQWRPEDLQLMDKSSHRKLHAALIRESKQNS